MFHQRWNELRLTMHLSTCAPLLIKAGETAGAVAPAADNLPFADLYEAEQRAIQARNERAQQARNERKKQAAEASGDQRKLREKLEADMRFVRTRRNGHEEPYLPGASLKGVLRSRCEQLLRTFAPQAPICDIFATDDTDDKERAEPRQRSCTVQVEQAASSERYAQACLICRLFGCGGLAGRVQISDAYLAPGCAPHWGERSGVGINRQRGAAEPGALFFYEVLEAGAFTLTVTVENFELWQVGLLAYALHDLWQGQLPVGYGTRRGLGRLTGKVEVATLSYFGIKDYAATDGCNLHGIASLQADGSALTALAAEPPPTALVGATAATAGLRTLWSLPATAQEQLWSAGSAALATLLKAQSVDATQKEATP